jgi:cation transport protein ChaC
MLRPTRPVRTTDRRVEAAHHPDGLWVFGYGSLMWRPGFAHARAVRARLTGYHRGFCLYSMHHRGTEARPGLVLGLDRCGVCEGMAFLVPPERIAATLAYLTEREQVSGVYRETYLPITLEEGARPEVVGLAYVVERAHPSYAGTLPLETEADLIRGAEGISGTNLDYLINTLAHLAQLGIRERRLERLMARIGAYLGRGTPDAHVSPRARAVRTAYCRHRFAAPRLRPYERVRFVHRKHLAGRMA